MRAPGSDSSHASQPVITGTATGHISTSLTSRNFRFLRHLFCRNLESTLSNYEGPTWRRMYHCLITRAFFVQQAAFFHAGSSTYSFSPRRCIIVHTGDNRPAIWPRCRACEPFARLHRVLSFTRAHAHTYSPSLPFDRGIINDKVATMHETGRSHAFYSFPWYLIA